jgi:hypothetical protein
MTQKDHDTKSQLHKRRRMTGAREWRERRRGSDGEGAKERERRRGSEGEGAKERGRRRRSGGEGAEEVLSRNDRWKFCKPEGSVVLSLEPSVMQMYA